MILGGLLPKNFRAFGAIVLIVLPKIKINPILLVLIKPGKYFLWKKCMFCREIFQGRRPPRPPPMSRKGVSQNIIYPPP